MTNLEKRYAAAEEARERALDAHRDQATNEGDCNLAWLAAEIAYAQAVKLEDYPAERTLRSSIIGQSISMGCFRLAERLAEHRQKHKTQRKLSQAA